MPELENKLYYNSNNEDVVKVVDGDIVLDNKVDGQIYNDSVDVNDDPGSAGVPIKAASESVSIKEEILKSELVVQPTEKHISSIVFVIVLILVIAAVSALGAYYYRDKVANEFEVKQANRITALNENKTDLTAELSTEKAKNTTNQTAYVSVAPSAIEIENIKAAIASGNIAALEGRIAANVNLLVAGSDSNAVKIITPALAVASITSFISGATSKWSFPPSS